MFGSHRKKRWCRKVGEVEARAYPKRRLSLVWDFGKILERGSEKWFAHRMWNARKTIEGDDAGGNVGIGECEPSGLAIVVQRVIRRP
jgi:hypothetical protein